MDIAPLALLPLFFTAGVFIVLCFHALINGGPRQRRLPPGPPALPALGNIHWLLWRWLVLSGKREHLSRDLHTAYGRMVTMRVGSIPVVLVSDRALAHEALVELGATFAGRLPTPPALRFLEGDLCRISTLDYGPLWRRLRRNLVTEVLHPSRVRLHEEGRSWALDLLLRRLRQSGDGLAVPRESFQFAVFSLLLLMCFGEKLEEKLIEEIMGTLRRLLLFSDKLTVFAVMPNITKYLFWRRRKTATKMQRKHMELLVHLIRARQESRRDSCSAYVDSLLDLDLEAEGRRKLEEDDVAALCSEFLAGGTETTAVALEWIMANLVKHQRIQGKLAREIESVAAPGDQGVTEADLERLPYLEAVVMEGLRRHPPAAELLAHTATAAGAVLGGYSIPKEVAICFAATGPSWEEEVWAEHAEFRPERFMAGGEGEGVDLTGSKEMKMMPFGAGRRICPGIGLAMLHLKYFVANLVWRLEWKAGEGEEVDLSETAEFAVAMKNPLRARVVPRARNQQKE